MLLIPYAFALPSVDQPVVTHAANTTDAAVVVGIGDYAFVPDVSYAEADATAFRAFAIQTLGIPDSRVWSPRTKNKENIEAAVKQAAGEVKRGGTLWVYFAGHGAADPSTHERLLLGVDVPDDASFPSRGVSLTALQAVATANGARMIVVSDVCYTGQFRSLVLDPPAPKGSVIEWSATQQGQVAAPLSGTEHGAFTYLVLGAFRGWADGEPAVEGAARAPADGVVTAQEARDFVARRLKALQMREQVPAMESGDGRYDLTLVKGVREEAPMLATASSTTPAPDDYAAKLAALAKAQSEAEEAKRAHDARVATEVANKRAEATRAWAATKPIVAKGGDAGKAAAKLFVDTYGAVSVTVDGERTSVEIPEVAEAKVALNAAPTSTASSPLVDTGTPGFGDEVVTIPAGTFTMGTPTTEANHDSDETQHRVTLSSFMMARTEVSQALWTKVMGKNPSVTEYKGVSLVGDRLPVQNVSWCDVVDFANRLSRLQGLAEVYAGVSECASTKGVSVTARSGATGWRLPTESEWEYAARAGTTGAWGAVTEESRVCGIGNVDDKSAAHFGSDWGNANCDDGHDGLAPVGSYRASGWGLYDTTGNVSEWTWDWLGAYPGASVTNPVGVSSGSKRVGRGGSWGAWAEASRVGIRDGTSPGYGWFGQGVRLARSLP